jgi:hypothetical protein
MDWKVGDYATTSRGGMTVRLHDEPVPGRFTIEFVSNYERGAGVCCGGYCSTEAAADLRPLKEIDHIILCAAYEAQRKIKAANAEIVTQTAIFDANKAALDAFKKARELAVTTGDRKS